MWYEIRVILRARFYNVNVNHFSWELVSYKNYYFYHIGGVL